MSAALIRNEPDGSNDMSDEFVDALLAQASKMQMAGWVNDKILLLLRSAAASNDHPPVVSEPSP